MSKICVHIPTHSFTQSFVKCLESVMDLDEIIIQDNSGGEHIKNYIDKLASGKIKYFESEIVDIRERLFHFKNFSNCEYILWVHTDEEYNPEIIHELYEKISLYPNLKGFKIFHQSIDFGESLGMWPEPQLRLFKKEGFIFNGNNIHDMPEVEGEIGVIKNTYTHYANYILGTSIVKNVKYEYLNADKLTDIELHDQSFDNKNSLWRFLFFVKLFVRINFQFFKIIFSFSKPPTYANTCIWVNQIIVLFCKRLIPTDQLRIRTGQIPNDTRGYL